MVNLIGLLLAGTSLLPAAPLPYDERVDARAEITRMLECAKAERKPLLLMFGANWCPWCRKLDRLLTTDKRLSRLADDAVLRLNIDIGQYDRNLDLARQYGLEALDDTGIPMLVVLRPDGSVQGVKNSDEFVSGSRFVSASIERFLLANSRR